jgi:hypothetical protein
MSASRAAVRSTRALRNKALVRNARFYATETTQAPQSNTASHIIAGLAGGGLVFAGGYAWYHTSGIKTAVNLAQSTKSTFDKTANKLSQSTPSSDEALRWLRETSLSYAAFIPGAKGIVNSTFDDLDTIRHKHGKEFDDALQKAYNDLKKITLEKGMSVETAQKAWQVVERFGKEMSELAGDAADEILQNHPELKKRVGGQLDQLKSMGESYGPEAKKQVDETWQQIKSVIAGGVSFETANKIKKLIDEKMAQVQKLGDAAWKQGLEQAQPYLDKNPKIKELVEHNADALKSGNLSELWSKVKAAATSGDTTSFEDYVKSASKSKQNGGDGEKYASMIPGAAGSILPMLSKMQELGEKHGREVERLAKETVEEVKQVLEKKMAEAEQLVGRAKKEAKE